MKLRLEELRRRLKEEVKSQMTLALVRRWSKPKEQEEEVVVRRRGEDVKENGRLEEIKPTKINVHGGVEDQTEVKLVDTDSLGRSEEESMRDVEGPAVGSDECKEVIEVG